MAAQIVPSGSYRISGEKSEILEAYLGSCVGLTLCDRTARLGGLLHLLLPEPTGEDIPYQPETYASVGLPIFVRALLDAGARRERLEACIAGGALVGPVSDRDLSLDIGGRTTEVVQDILRAEGIHITRAETGGYLGCRLSLDLQKLESRIEPLGSRTDQIHSNFEIVSPEEIEKAIQLVKPIPQIALRIIRMLRNDDYDMDDIAAGVGQDQVICGKVINLCNTAMTGLRTRADSIERALIALGEKRLLQLVLSASLEPVFTLSPAGYSLCKGGIFQHALGTAMVTQELAVLTEKSASDIAYTAGLLHDIGKIPLDQYMSSRVPLFYRTIQAEGTALCDVERENFGISHTETGRMLGDRWNLSENLKDVIHCHHHPEEAVNAPHLAALVYLADLAMSRFRVGYELEFMNTDQLKWALETAGLRPDQFPTIVARIPHRVLETSLTGL